MPRLRIREQVVVVVTGLSSLTSYGILSLAIYILNEDNYLIV